MMRFCFVVIKKDSVSGLTNADEIELMNTAKMLIDKAAEKISKNQNIPFAKALEVALEVVKEIKETKI